MGKSIWFLNPEVEKQVIQEGPAFFIAWCITWDQYESDVDSLHNPDWVAHFQRRELKHLEKLRHRFQGLLQEYNEVAGTNPPLE
jgi:hypothetical protein